MMIEFIMSMYMLGFGKCMYMFFVEGEFLMFWYKDTRMKEWKMMIKIHWCIYVRVWISIYFYEPLIISFMTLWKVRNYEKEKSNHETFCYYVGFKDLLPIENVERPSYFYNTQLHGDLC